MCRRSNTDVTPREEPANRSPEPPHATAFTSQEVVLPGCASIATWRRPRISNTWMAPPSDPAAKMRPSVAVSPSTAGGRSVAAVMQAPVEAASATERQKQAAGVCHLWRTEARDTSHRPTIPFLSPAVHHGTRPTSTIDTIDHTDTQAQAQTPPPKEPQPQIRRHSHMRRHTHSISRGEEKEGTHMLATHTQGFALSR